jgi:hypothetical protein
MEKFYKIPIVLAFCNAGSIKMGITEEDVYLSYLKFYQQGINWKDLEKDKSSSSYKQWDRNKYISEAKKNPIHFLKESGKGFFIFYNSCYFNSALIENMIFLCIKCKVSNKQI